MIQHLDKTDVQQLQYMYLFSLLHIFVLFLLLLLLLLLLFYNHHLKSEEERTLYEESLDHLLEVWVRIVEATETFPSQLLTQPCTEVFTAYVQSKLSSPLGWRTKHSMDCTEVVVEVEEDDRISYSEQLSSVGALARCVPDHSLPLILTSLSQCISDYLQLYKLLQENKQALYSHQSRLESLHEDIHWLILIAGYTVCDVVEGEESFIPRQMMRHSISEQDSVVKGIDFRGLVLSCTNPSIVSGGAAMDKVVALVAVVCQWCVLEKAFVESGLAEVLSPQVCESTVWFLSAIAQSYLMLEEANYEQVFPL